MSSRILFGLLVVALAGTSWAQEEKPSSQTEATVPGPTPAHPLGITPEDAARKNPVKLTQTSLERGKKIYATQCALCHGASGDGKTELAEEMQINPPNFTKAEVMEKRTDGELFAIISQGSGPMPGQAGRMKDREKWDLVNYVRSLSGKAVEKSTVKEPEENVILVPQ